MKRVSELRYGIPVDGARVKLSQIEAADVVILSFAFFEAELGQAVVIQMEQEGKPYWCLTFSTIVMAVLAELKGQEPYLARFSQRTSASGREYWTME